MTTIYTALIIVGLGVLAVGVGSFLALAQHGVSEDPELEREYEAGWYAAPDDIEIVFRRWKLEQAIRQAEREGREILERERYG